MVEYASDAVRSLYRCGETTIEDNFSMHFLRSLLIPLACVLCLSLAWYLMNDADQRFERERVGRAIELPNGNEADLSSDDQGALASGDPPPSKTPANPLEPATAGESSKYDMSPSSENGKATDKPSAMLPVSEEDHSSPMLSVLSEQSVNSLKSEPKSEPLEAASGPLQSTGNLSVGKSKLSNSGTLPIHLLAVPAGNVEQTSDPIASKPIASDSPSSLLPILLNRASQSTVRFDRKDGSLLGCGVIVSTSIHGFDVLTANHLFAETELFSITTFDRDSVEGAFYTRTYDSVRVMKRSAAMDLALVRVQSVIVPGYTASLAELGTPKTPAEFSGWAVYCDGAGAPTWNKVSKAEKTTARRTKDSEMIDYWKIERESVRGASGSGLFDDQGQLVGIASGNSRGFAYYCHANGIAKFLKD